MAQRFFELDKNSFSRYLGREVCLCIELSHSLWSTTYRLINDTKELTVNDVTFQPYPFDIVMPSQKEHQGTQIVLSNIKNLAANIIEQTIGSNENIALQLYLINREENASELYDKGLFEVFNPEITNEAITANINLRHSFNINCGSMRYNRQLFPNLFL